MSDPTDNAQITEELQILQIEIFFIWSATALVTYEYLITIHNEITMVWRKKWTAATWLFILNRYLLVAYTILSIVPYTPRSDLTGIICTMQDVRVSCISGFFYPSLAIISCIGTAQLVNLVNLSQYIVFALFSALRAYAIHNFNIAIFLAVFSLNVIPVGTNIYTYVRTPEAYVGGICTQSASIPADISFDLAMIAGDLAVLVVTWMKTFEQFREARAFEISTLTGILLRDGTVYFMALLAMNIAQICFSSIPSLHNSVGVPTVLFIQVLTPILISRFLLNLRDANNRGINPQGTTLSQFSVPEFRHSFPARHIGAMGESLDHSLSAVQDEDAEEAPYNSTSSVVLGPDDENDIEGARQISHEEVV